MGRAARHVLLLAVGTVVGFLFAADGLRRALPARAPAPAADADRIPRVIVLGFDGVDPRILAERMDRGELPHLRRLRDEGAFHPLASETPPESPTAWASLLTGVNPGRHGIHDFVRPGREYRPENGMVDVTPMRLLLGKVPIRPPIVRSRMRAPSFLERVRDAGYPVLSLRQPHAFPVANTPGLDVLSGLGTPDLAGSAGFYTVWSAEVGFTAGDTIFGGLRVPVASDPSGVRFVTELPGPYDPTLARGPRGERRRATLPLVFTRVDEPTGPLVSITLAGRTELVAPGERSGFFEVGFRLGTLPSLEVRGHVRFEVLRLDPLKVMADPIQPYAPDPPLPVTSPPRYGRDLWERYGPFETVGWPEQTFALNDRVQDDRGFQRDLLEDMDRGAGLLLGELSRGSRCVFYVFTATDRAYHAFYRYYDDRHPLHAEAVATGLVDPAGPVYARMDDIVGDVASRLAPEDLLLVVSDHGFQTWRWAVNVNRWLVDEGYLVLKGSVGEQNLARFFGGGDMDVDQVDWSRTRAYAMGLGQVFLNLKGRESQGIVEPTDAQALTAEIAERLLTIVNPLAPGEKAVSRVFRLREEYHGPFAEEAAEIQIGFARGYRISWQTALLGGMDRPAVIEENRVPWSGDHCSTDPAEVPGILLVNRRIPPAPPDRPYHLRDVAPTVLRWFGVDPGDLDGRPIPVDAPPTGR